MNETTQQVIKLLQNGAVLMTRVNETNKLLITNLDPKMIDGENPKLNNLVPISHIEWLQEQLENYLSITNNYRLFDIILYAADEDIQIAVRLGDGKVEFKKQN